MMSWSRWRMARNSKGSEIVSISYSKHTEPEKPFKNYYTTLRKSELQILKCTGRKRIYDKQTNQP